jgi:hypothetical protein
VGVHRRKVRVLPPLELTAHCTASGTRLRRSAAARSVQQSSAAKMLEPIPQPCQVPRRRPQDARHLSSRDPPLHRFRDDFPPHHGLRLSGRPNASPWYRPSPIFSPAIWWSTSVSAHESDICRAPDSVSGASLTNASPGATVHEGQLTDHRSSGMTYRHGPRAGQAPVHQDDHSACTPLQRWLLRAHDGPEHQASPSQPERVHVSPAQAGSAVPDGPRFGQQPVRCHDLPPDVCGGAKPDRHNAP